MFSWVRLSCSSSGMRVSTNSILTYVLGLRKDVVEAAERRTAHNDGWNGKLNSIKHVVSMWLISLHWLHSSHYYEPSSPQQPLLLETHFDSAVHRPVAAVGELQGVKEELEGLHNVLWGAWRSSWCLMWVQEVCSDTCRIFSSHTQLTWHPTLLALNLVSEHFVLFCT